MSFLSNLLKSTDLLATNVFSWNVDFLVECMSQNGNAVFRDKVLETRVSPRRCWIVLALTGVYSGVMFDFLQVCPFTGIGFSTMFDFCKCVSFHRLLGCPLQCLTFTSVSFHWYWGVLDASHWHLSPDKWSRWWNETQYKNTQSWVLSEVLGLLWRNPAQLFKG